MSYASRHPVRAQSDRFLAPGQRADRVFQLSCGPAKAADASFCASRTRMPSAAQLRFRDGADGGIALAGIGLGRGTGYRRPVRSVLPGGARRISIRTLFARLEAQGHAYPCYCTPEELELSRKLQRMAGKPPRYAGTCRRLTATQRAERAARGLRPTLRFAVPAGEVIEFTDAVHGPQRILIERHRRFHHSPRGWHLGILFLQRRR